MNSAPDRVPYSDPRWHPDMRPDVVVHVRSASDGEGAYAVLTATPPTGHEFEGRRGRSQKLDRTMLTMGLVDRWMRALEEPACILLDLDDDAAAELLLLEGDAGRPELRPFANRFYGEAGFLGAHHLRRIGTARPVTEWYCSGVVDGDDLLIFDETKRGEA